MKRIITITFAAIMSFLLMITADALGTNQGLITSVRLQETSLVEQPVKSVDIQSIDWSVKQPI